MGALSLTSPQKEWFGPGGSVAIAGYKSVGRNFLVGLRARSLLLSHNKSDVASVGEVQRGVGTYTSASIALRLRPLSFGHTLRRATGLWIEGGFGIGLTGGDYVKMSVEGALGWGFGIGKSIAVGPVVRYLQVLQPATGELSDADARIALVGLEVSFFDGVIEESVQKKSPKKVEKKTESKSDKDKDGVPDDVDKCPTKPEDEDGFEDEDGCPDPDNDSDGVPDVRDKCPTEPEDVDQFEDDDGCPDRDNDKDGVLDTIDRCPNEAEVINGVDDQDGCPDEGLIEVIHDRVVLDERVLFDSGMARVRHRAYPLLKAIVELWKQHPEWAKMRVEGHTDHRGSDELNQKLSERRAHNVVKQLVKTGFKQNRLEYVGYGKSKPRDLHNTESAYERNRRVEFVIIKSSGDEEGEEPNEKQ